MGGVSLNKLNHNKSIINNELCEKIIKELLPKLEKLNFTLKSINLEENPQDIIQLKLAKI